MIKVEFSAKIVSVENSCAASYWYSGFFEILFEHLFEIEIFCSIMNVSTVIFDEFRTFLLKESINYEPTNLAVFMYK